MFHKLITMFLSEKDKAELENLPKSLYDSKHIWKNHKAKNRELARLRDKNPQENDRYQIAVKRPEKGGNEMPQIYLAQWRAELRDDYCKRLIGSSSPGSKEFELRVVMRDWIKRGRPNEPRKVVLSEGLKGGAGDRAE
jgi:hypothetical protein